MKKHLLTSNKGFTLVELMAVVIIIIILVGLMVFGASYANRKASTEHTAAEIKTLESALEAYRLDIGTYPTFTPPGNNLGVLLGKYLASWPTSRRTGNQLFDPFFIAYNYRFPGTINTASPTNGASGGYDLWSSGPNRINDNGGNDDIASWTR